jgi:hypothetical protein
VTTLVPTEHVARSVEAAGQALTQLERQLRAGGFAEGATAYAQMADVLVAQRVFLAGDDDALAASFGQLGGTARRVFELLEPYTAAMRRLATLAPPRADAKDVQAVREQLARRGRRGTSVPVLARATRLPTERVEVALAELCTQGTALRRTVGDITSYRLGDAAPARRTATKP